MKVVILAGGLGTRISEESYLKPKPMIEIGGRPILWHVISIYAAQGFDRFLLATGYLGEIEPALLPYGEEAIGRLLMIFELEKAVYELRYEINNRPDWVGIPVAGIIRLLEDEEEPA